MSINGFLNLGTSLSGTTVVTPAASANYAACPIVFDEFLGGVTLSGVSCVFGPVVGSWGTLSVFGVTDEDDNPVWAGTLAAPFTPLNGQLVIVPQGDISLVVGGQFAAAPQTIAAAASGPMTTGSISIASSGWTQVAASGTRGMLIVQNPSDVGLVYLIFGGSEPASGAASSYVLVPFGAWPPPGTSTFVDASVIWAKSSSATGVVTRITGTL